MDKGIAALIGAAALTTVTAAPAVSASGLAPATNYRELLDPVPNALNALKADETNADAREAVVIEAQYRRYHHHHHHHRYFRRRHRFY